MRMFSRLRITALAAATVTALALGACASDEDLGTDEAALAQDQDQAASPELAPVASDESAVTASSVVLSLSCPCSGAFARCSGEATGGNGTYVIKFTNSAGSVITIPNSGGFFSFGTGMNHGTLKVTATSAGSSRTRSWNVSCSTNPGNPL